MAWMSHQPYRRAGRGSCLQAGAARSCARIGDLYAIGFGHKIEPRDILGMPRTVTRPDSYALTH
jgi:hypothetical protein